MFISHTDKFIFFHIPKAAGTSIHFAFKDVFKVKDRADPLPPIHHITPTEFLKNNPECKDYFKFAFVRNPWERALSGFFDFKSNADRVGYKVNGISIHDFSSFEDFIKSLENSGWIKDPHFRPQSDYIFYEDGELALDFIGRVESLPQDVDKISPIVKITNGDIHRVKQYFRGKPRQTNHDPYREHYSEETKKIISSLYGKDIEYLRYEF
jgi:hypothetical protein